jgi:hypothetical protein
MAKKKKKSDDAKPAAPAKADAPAASTTPTAATPAEIAFQRGNYSAVRQLAKAGDESALKLEPLTKIDMGQIAAGIVAFVVVLTIVFFTVRG